MSSLDLDTARSIIAATLAAGRDRGFKPLSVAVLDSGGHLIAFEREDGSSTHRFQVAHGKAHGAIAMGVGSRGLNKLAEDRPYFMSAVVAAVGGAMVPVPGGVLVCDESGTVLGAAGVSGDISDNDEEALVAGIESIGLVARPD
jgi:uncharacterized protein GlcG (DUF336 family)